MSDSSPFSASRTDTPAAGAPDIDEALHRDLRAWLGAASFDTLIAQCWQDAGEVLADLAESERIHERDRMRAAAHKLKGLALSFGYPQLAGLAGKLESACLFAAALTPASAQLQAAAARARAAHGDASA
jgi:chemotaxis protein histidine kinase CheA